MSKSRKKPIIAEEPIVQQILEEQPLTVNTVITYNGKTYPRNECRLINGKYYKIGNINQKDSGDCYQINDTYYRIVSKRIAWDYLLKQYNLIDNMVQGFVPDKSNNKGYFTKTNDCIISADDEFIMNEETALYLNMQYDFSKGAYSFNPVFNSPMVLRSKPTYRTLPTNIYGMAEYPAEIIENIKNQSESIEYAKSNFDKFLFDYTFGLEIETDGGWFPEKLYYKYGALPLKDGSILGTEITTLPSKLSVDYIRQLFTDLSTYTMAQQNNSLHVNMSGFENTPKFRVALYVLYYRLQQEINQFIPLYKRDLNYFLSKAGGAKDHCKPLESLGIVKRYNIESNEDINNADKLIFTWLNEGVYNNTFNIETRRHQKQNHPKWEWHSRYYALNLMPLYFGNPAFSRIEYRVHSGTVNKHKALAWIFITSAITKFVELHADRILYTKDKIDLDEIFNVVYDPINDTDGKIIYDFLKTYIQLRINDNVQKVIRHDGNVYGNEFRSDNNFAIPNAILNEPKKRS